MLNMDHLNEFVNDVINLKKITHSLYIYGTGMYGRNIYNVLSENGIHISGFIVSRKDSEKSLFGLEITEAENIIYDNIGIVLGLNRHNKNEVNDILIQSGFDMAHVIDGGSFIENGGIRAGYSNAATIEITTRIGCSVNCKFCPQELLLEHYFLNDKKRENVMSLEIFEKCLNKMPENCNVVFCGMAEPFLNPDCGDMIRMASASGRVVNLYTTLCGLTKDKWEKICDIPVDFVTLHVADKYNYAHIPLTKEYFEVLEAIINYTKADGKPYVNMCNAQAEPEERVAQICKGKYEVLTSLLDRAGNLADDKLISRKKIDGKITCGMCGSELNHNILLPDGTMILCCMDYGMKHVLGNLYEESYEEIIHGNEITMIKRQMNEQCGEDILCRKCSCANAVI